MAAMTPLFVAAFHDLDPVKDGTLPGIAGITIASFQKVTITFPGIDTIQSCDLPAHLAARPVAQSIQVCSLSRCKGAAK